MATSNEEISAPEIFIALCAPVGADTELVTNALEKELRDVGYECVHVRISKMLDQIPGFEELNKVTDEQQRISRAMDAGNELRRRARDNAAAAWLAISEIREARILRNNKDLPLPGTAYIIRSLKREEEVDTFRNLYGQNFFLISIYESEDRRIGKVARRIAKSRNSPDIDNTRSEARGLVHRDKKENSDTAGQGLEDVFPLADFFVNTDMGDPKRQISRFVFLVFSHPFITPSPMEILMFHAWSASLRSSDLSRQVGAVISSSSGDLLSTGCNEVPRPGHGIVWDDVAGSSKDYRDYKEGFDPSASARKRIVMDTLSALDEVNWLNKDIVKKHGIEALTRIALQGKESFLKKREISSLIEFGRIVHAEMAAICDAARRGVSIQGSTLYCTTFPCHVCARHIIAAGVQRVVYIEPYPKSRAKELYRRTIRVDGDGEADSDAVEFVPFSGVAPRRFISLFSMGQRKDDSGYALPEAPVQRTPKGVARGRLPLELETALVGSLESVMMRMHPDGLDSEEIRDESGAA